MEKEKIKIRPFKNIKELGEVRKKNNYLPIVADTPWGERVSFTVMDFGDKRGISLCHSVYIDPKFVTWNDLLKYYKFSDGTKCGITL